MWFFESFSWQVEGAIINWKWHIDGVIYNVKNGGMESVEILYIFVKNNDDPENNPTKPKKCRQ
jgi:hypothetical protein